MRLIAVLAACVIVSPAAAQSWQQYNYPDYSFAVAFPADPQIETTSFEVADGVAVPAHVYSVRQDDTLLKMTVADLGDVGAKEDAVIDHAIRSLSEGGSVNVNIPHRINRVYGRQLSIAGADGSRSMAAVFDYNGRLYEIEAKSLSAGNDAMTDALRFTQSLIFTGGGSNRSPDEVRAAREACRNANGPAVAGDPGAAASADGGRRHERRCRRGAL